MIHFSYNKIKKIYRIKEQDNPYKPQGLWYSTSSQWLEFYRNNIGEIKNCRYMYKLKLNYTKYSITDPKKVLRIKNESTFDKFTIKYGSVVKSKYSDNRFSFTIDWNKVADEYGGIEVIPLIKSRKNTEDPDIIKKYNDHFKFADNIDGVRLAFWLDTFDIDSGCVWEPEAVKKIKRIYKI